MDLKVAANAKYQEFLKSEGYLAYRYHRYKIRTFLISKTDIVKSPMEILKEVLSLESMPITTVAKSNSTATKIGLAWDFINVSQEFVSYFTRNSLHLSSFFKVSLKIDDQPLTTNFEDLIYRSAFRLNAKRDVIFLRKILTGAGQYPKKLTVIYKITKKIDAEKAILSVS